MPRYHVPAVERAFRIIELLGAAEAPVRMSDLSSMLNIPKTTILMILTTLERMEYVSKTPHGQYQLTTKFIELGSKSRSLKSLAREHLEGLANELKLTVHLSGCIDDENVLIDKVNGPGFIQFSTFEGKRQSFHATSSGKAMLAFMGDEQLSGILQKHPLKQYTPHTVTTVEQLMRQLEFVRRNGYAVEDEEEEAGVRCIGAPIFNASHHLVAAVSVTGVLSELNGLAIPAVAEKVKQTAEIISQVLGYEVSSMVRD